MRKEIEIGRLCGFSTYSCHWILFLHVNHRPHIARPRNHDGNRRFRLGYSWRSQHRIDHYRADRKA